MARNEEKQFGRLNRFLLQQDKEEQAKKNPPRPKLSTLNNAAEIRKWLPTISRDLDLCLKQSQVGCYPESVIDGHKERIAFLEREYKAFVRKLKQYDPECEVFCAAHYMSKNRNTVPKDSSIDTSLAPDVQPSAKKLKLDNELVPRTVSRLQLPILTGETGNQYDDAESSEDHSGLQDKPLCFQDSTACSSRNIGRHEGGGTCTDGQAVRTGQQVTGMSTVQVAVSDALGASKPGVGSVINTNTSTTVCRTSGSSTINSLISSVVRKSAGKPVSSGSAACSSLAALGAAYDYSDSDSDGDS